MIIIHKVRIPSSGNTYHSILKSGDQRVLTSTLLVMQGAFDKHIIGFMTMGCQISHTFESEGFVCAHKSVRPRPHVSLSREKRVSTPTAIMGFKYY